jgi:UDP-N-acetyl-D-glucosamine dehydrogenase
VPRLVGGDDAAATAARGALLRRINDHVSELSSPDAAELAKLLENVFRNVNIALVNQLALLCERMGLDVWEVIDARGDEAVRVHAFTPGPASAATASRSTRTTSPGGAGSSTSWTASSSSPATSTLAMPRHVVDLVAEALNDAGVRPGARVGIVGVRVQAERPRSRNSPRPTRWQGSADESAAPELMYHGPALIPTFRHRRRERMRRDRARWSCFEARRRRA